MKQTEVGLIPDDWEVKRLGEISNGFSYGVGAEAVSFNGSDRYIRITDIDDVTNRFVPNPLCSPKFYSSSDIVQENDILFARTGASVGKTYIYDKKDGRLIFAGFLMKLHVKDADSKFIFYQTLTDKYKSWVISESMRTGQPGLNLEQIKNFLIPLPPLAEQQQIAKALSDVDALISTTEKLIQKKKNIKQGTMQNLLTGKKRLPGFGPQNKSPTYKQTELGPIPEDWEVKNIMDILISSKDKLKIGPFGSQLKKEYLLSNGFYKVFGQENIYSGNFEYCYRFLTKEHFQKLQSCELKPGDFVISTMGTIGKCDIVPENVGVGIMDSHLVRLRLLNSMDKNFFKYFFQSDLIQKQIVALSVGGIMDGLSTAIIKKLNVIEFSKEEQTAIANVLSNMDKEIETLNTKLEKYRNLKTAMMQQLLTGKIRLVK